MDRDKRRSSESPETDPMADLRPGVMSADATGLIAGEELITEAETMLPLEAETPEPGTKRPSPKGPQARK